MPDREKVVERLTGLKELLKFQKDILGYGSFIEDINDALALLKEQEAVKPVKQIEENEWTVCGHCRKHLISKWMFCPYCGRSVKWE